MMVERLKYEVTSHSSNDLLNICVKMGVSWSAQDFRQTGVTPSGPDVHLGISSSLIFSAGGGGGCRRCEWCFFKPAVELIQIVCQLLILHSAYCSDNLLNICIA